MNNRMRAAAKNDMAKDFHKLMNNAVYGKTWEKQKKRTDIHLVNDRVKAAKLVDKPHCLDARIFNEKLVRIEMQKVKMLLPKPSYVGFVVLELSKLQMLKYAIPAYHPTIPITLLYFPLNNTSPPIKRFHNCTQKVPLRHHQGALRGEGPSPLHGYRLLDVPHRDAGRLQGHG